jgi:hypothetical protein
MEDIIVPSPDLLHKAVLKYVDEIRFGAAYYSLTIDKISYVERVLAIHICGLLILASSQSRNGKRRVKAAVLKQDCS